MRNELRVSFFFATAVTGGIGMLLPASMRSGRVEWFLFGGLFTVLTLVGAVLFLFLTRRWLAWSVTFVEILAAMALLLAVGGSCLTLVLLAFPVITALRIWKWQSLESEAIALPA